MNQSEPIQRWHRVSQLLHWLSAACIIVLAVVGLTMVKLPKTPTYFWVYTLHKSIGITVLGLVILRLVWRLTVKPPAPIPHLTLWHQRLIRLSHGSLYGLLLIVPLSGWLYDSASGLRPFRLFGLVAMPKLIAPDTIMKHRAHEWHEYGFWILAGLVIMHVGAALYHHWIVRDNVMRRMLPGKESYHG